MAYAAVLFVVAAAAAIPFGNHLRTHVAAKSLRRDLPRRGHTLEDVS